MVNQLKEQLKRHEGTVRLGNGAHKPYLCPAGKLTLGYGRNIEERGITEDEADYLLSNDIAIAQRELAGTLPWFLSLDEVRQDALINMHFNLGLSRLLGFRKTLAAFAAGDWKKAGDEMLDSRWARQVGARAQELADQVRSGSYAK